MPPFKLRYLITSLQLCLFSIPSYAEDVQELPTIAVKAKDKGSGYLADKVTLGKTENSLKDTPQSISILTRKRLDDQNINTLDEAMKNIIGVTVVRYDSAGTYNSFYARGFGSDTYQIDGTKLKTDINGSYLDLAVYDQIEVLKGTSSLFSGAGEPGVTFNMVRKRALDHTVIDTKLSAGSWDNYRADFDVTGKLNQDGTLRGRFVSALQFYDTYMNGIDDNSKKLIYGTLEYDLAENTTLSIGGTYQNIDTVLSRGLPTWSNGTLLNVPVETTYVQDWNKQRLKTIEAFTELEHKLENDGKIKATIRYLNRDNNAQYSDPTIPDQNGNMSNFTAAAFKRQDTDISSDLFFTTPFKFGNKTHNFLIGADYLKSFGNVNATSYNIALGSSVINVNNDNQYAFSLPDFVYNINTSKYDIENYGIYSQLRFNLLKDLTLVGGGRISWWKSKDQTLRSNGVDVNATSTYSENGKFTPYTSLIYTITPNVSVYSSFSQIFKPQNNYSYDANDPTGKGIQIKPRIGNQIELGLKASLLDQRLNIATAIFQIKDRNRAVTDVEHSNYSVALGKVRSRGFEFEINGNLTEHWHLTTGYAFNESKYLLDTSQTGQAFSTFTPKHSFNFWTHYQLPEDIISGIDIGAGIRTVSQFYLCTRQK